LQTAAVIGTEVSLPLLQAIAELPEETLHRGLAHLQAAEFLYETRLFPDHEYTFKHALTHEVAYGSLLQERRRGLHAHIVEAFEALTGDRVAEQVELLAHHALRGEVWDKALAYCRQAGEKAMARSAHREAVGYFEQALSALAHLPEQRDTREQAIDLRFALRSALVPSGDFGSIVEYLHEAESLATALNDPDRLGKVSIFLSTHFYLRDAYDQAIAAAQRALMLTMAGGDVVLQAQANQYLGMTYGAQGDYQRAIACLRQTMASFDGARCFERFGEYFLPAVHSRAWLAVYNAELGMFTAGRALGEEGLQIAKVVEHPASLMVASWGLGLLSLRQGDVARALPLLEQAIGLCQELPLSLPFPRIAAALGTMYTMVGRGADAVSLLMHTLTQSTTTERVHYEILCSLPLGEAQMLASCLEEAHIRAERALALARALQERGSQAYALRLLGEIAARREPLESALAEAHYRQAQCHRGLGTLYAKMGQQQARTELAAAIDLYRAMDMTFWLPQTEEPLAQVIE
jgi:tetratricopeptide (TPR) repeat protein